MAFDIKQEINQMLPSNAGGKYRFWARGIGEIAGVTKIDNVLSSCRVFLHAGDGTLLGYRLTGSDGTYVFQGLPPGEYRLVIEDDRQVFRRSKVEHVVLAAPPPGQGTKIGWRIYITAVDPASLYKGIGEVEFLNANGVKLTSPYDATEKAFASTEVNGWNLARMAFNGVSAEGWLSLSNEGDEFIGWMFGAIGGPDVDVKSVALRGSPNHPEGSPIDFAIQYTVDGSIWVDALVVTGQPSWTGSSDRRVFAIP